MELAVRNAMHAALTDWSAAMNGRSDWYRAATDMLTDAARRDIVEAMRRVGRTGKPHTAGRVVAESSFGFWRFLLAARYDRTLWRMCLYQAFPGSTGSRREVHDVVARLHELRNRIAHHEPIHNRPLRRLHEDALIVAEWICPDTRRWIEAGCRVPALLIGRRSDGTR